MINAQAEPLMLEIHSFRHKFFCQAMTYTRNKALSEELSYEIQLYAIEHRVEYDPSKGELVNWLHRLADNYLKNYFRDQSRSARLGHTVQLSDEVEHAIAEVEDPSDLEYEELLDSTIDAIHALPKAFIDAARLVILEGYSEKEVASYLGLPKGTVKSRLSRARALLVEMLGLSDRRRGKHRPTPTPVYREVDADGDVYPPPRTRSEVFARAAEIYGEGLARQVYWKQPASLFGNPLLLEAPAPVMEVEHEGKIRRIPYNMKEVPPSAWFTASPKLNPEKESR